MSLYDVEDAPEIEAGLAASPPLAPLGLRIDPISRSWPPTLALEIAMQVTTVRETCQAYDISSAQWDEIRANKSFQAELAGYVEMLRKDGMAFKARAYLQALDLLKESWRLIHDPATPPAVKADLIKYTINAAGLNEGTKKSSATIGIAGTSTNGFSIIMALGD